MFSVLIAFGASPGDSCDYDANGDSECEPDNGLYCVSYKCALVTDPSIYCDDPDEGDHYTKTTLTARYRDFYGEFVDYTEDDSCAIGFNSQHFLAAFPDW